MNLTILLLVLLSTVLHATWNLLAKSRRDTGVLFLRMAMLIAAVGLIPAIVAEWNGAGILRSIWIYALFSGLGLSLYYFALAGGYRTGKFTQMYPLARAIPVLALALFDVIRGRYPSPMGWVGMLLVSVGCLLVPLDSLRSFRLSRYFTRTVLWALLASGGSIAAYAIDKVAGEIVGRGMGRIGMYSVWQYVAVVPWLALLLRTQPRQEHTTRAAGWLAALAAGAFCFTAYWLILFAFQHSPYASYIIALRQFSIVLAVVAALALFREPAPLMRLAASLLILAGVCCIAIAT